MADKPGRGCLLDPYRVLDLTDQTGLLCGKILGDLGADVIKIERPGGNSSRNIGPFYHDIPHPEKSLFWFSYNTSKRSITLNIETRDGQEIFKRLLRTADFVVESFPTGYMNEIGLAYSVISNINPRIVMVSITPFGQTGPYRHYRSSDVVSMAMGGMMFVCGDPDRAPIRCSVEQAHLQVGAQAAVGAMIAHYYRQKTGVGQHIDVSEHEAIISALTFVQNYWEADGTIMRREGVWQQRGAIKKRLIYRCKDGYVSWQFFTGQAGRRTRALVEWMDSEGMAEDLKKVRWESVDQKDVTQEQEDAWTQSFQRFFITKDKATLQSEATNRGVLLAPVNTIRDVMENEQLTFRKFWIQAKHPDLDVPLSYPGAPFKSTELGWRISRRPPLVGEHNVEIFEKELGISREELICLKKSGAI